MQPPILAFSDDLEIFDSVEDAERYFEPWAVNDNLHIYDRFATILQATVEMRKKFLLTHEVVVVREKIPQQNDESDLRARLVEYLQGLKELGISDSEVPSWAALPDLIEQAYKHARTR